MIRCVKACPTMLGFMLLYQTRCDVVIRTKSNGVGAIYGLLTTKITARMTQCGIEKNLMLTK